MRDPQRINEVLAELKRVWELQPDLRLGQLIVIASHPKEACPDVFYVEDDKLLAGIYSKGAAPNRFRRLFYIVRHSIASWPTIFYPRKKLMRY
jgi:hypothetical protein